MLVGIFLELLLPLYHHINTANNKAFLFI